MNVIETIIQKNNGYISRKEAIANGVSSASFSRYIKTGELQKISAGKYATCDFDFDDLYLLQQRYPTIVFSGLTALHLYHLSNFIPDYIEFSVPRGSRVRKETIDNNIICHVENNIDYFNYANSSTKSIFTNVVKCYSMEKLIVEMIRKRDDYPSEIYCRALKLYVKRNDKNIPLLLECAKKRNIEKKVHEIIELLMYENQ